MAREIRERVKEQIREGIKPIVWAVTDGIRFQDLNEILFDDAIEFLKVLFYTNLH